MNNAIINSLICLGGIVIGSFVNMGIIFFGSKLIPAPDGMNIMDAESIKAHLHLFEFKHYIFPFLAHAGGTLVGAIFVAYLGRSHHQKLAMFIGVFFLIGGIWNTQLIPAPLLYNFLDISLCYIPMGWLGWKLSGKTSG